MPIVLKAGSRPPWVGLAAAVWVLFAAGNNYNFALFSHSLKSVLGYNQQQITFLGVANDIGSSVGILAGIAINKFPPWKVLFFGALCCFLGYGAIWAAVTQTMQNMPYYLLWMAMLIGANSCAWFQTAVVVINMRNFPLSRGTVSGILKGYVGLSAAIYTVIYIVVLDKSDSAFLLFQTVGLPVICCSVMCFIRPCNPASGEKSSEHVHFLFTQGASILLAIYILVITIINDKFSFGKPISYTLFAIMVSLLLAPLVIPIKMTLFRANKRPAISAGEPVSAEVISNITQPLLDSKDAPHVEDLPDPREGALDQKEASQEESLPTSLPVTFVQAIGASQTEIFPASGESEDESKSLLTAYPSATFVDSFLGGEETSRQNILLAVGMGAKQKRLPEMGEDFRFHEALLKADFWLLWLVYSIGVGTGVTVLNNLAQIGYAQGEYDTTVLLALFAFFNFVGRLSGGSVSEYLVRSKCIPRTILMVVTQAVMVVTFLLYFSSSSATLYAATMLLGICYGVHSSVMTPTASELFGLKHVGVIYNFIQLGNPIGALLFSVLLAGNLYDAEAAKQGVTTCLGATCFGLTYLVLAAVCGIGVVLGVYLTIRIKPVYLELYGRDSFCASMGSDP